MNLPDGAEFPQHVKVAAFSDDMDVLHAFIHNSGYVLCTWNEMENAYVPTEKTCSVLIDEFFEIDREELENELRVIRGLLIDMLAREAADDMFAQMGLLVQEENAATHEAADDVFKQLDLLIKKEEDDD